MPEKCSIKQQEVQMRGWRCVFIREPGRLHGAMGGLPWASHDVVGGAHGAASPTCDAVRLMARLA
ncbi:hypothetical protein JCGZ_22043 [Jatropha curcas]|uniref:Uncharacterized protein n=1 Tax=Jatropha curcas TaxID=180498 RepID=A0A067JT26_JATCU|nr:hypothetical protein JCGZ_22043 [Jatropha curcas]